MAKTIKFRLPGSGGLQTAPPIYQRYTTDRKKVRFNVAADNAYPNAGGGLGGYPIVAADLGFATQIDFLDMTGEIAAGGTANTAACWNPATQKLQFYVVSTGAEVANGVDLSASNIDCSAEGV